MSEPLNANPESSVHDATPEPDELAGQSSAQTDVGPQLEETVNAVPVLAEARPVTVAHTTLPAVQAAAVAATGFVAGAATLALVRRHSARKLARSRALPRRAVDMLPIVGSRTFIVDVHMLAKPGE